MPQIFNSSLYIITSGYTLYWDCDLNLFNQEIAWIALGSVTISLFSKYNIDISGSNNNTNQMLDCSNVSININ